MLTPNAPAGAPAAPATRRRLLAVDVLVTQAGELVPLDVRLPENAQRITGLYATATLMPGRLLQRRDAFVVFGDGSGPAGATRNAPAGTAAQRSGQPLSVGLALQTGYLLADSLDAFNPALHVGFFTPLTDELALQQLVVPAGLYVYYAHTVSVGVPRLLDKHGNPLTLTVEPTYGQVRTLFTQYQGSGAARTPVPDSLAYLARVEFPPASTDQQAALFNADTSGYRDGVLFPGDPSRY